MNLDALIEKIAEKSGEEKAVVRKELETYIAEIQSIKKGSPVKLEGFGTFRLKKGRLSFDTDPNFALEINYKYAGMTPIEVKKGLSVDEEEGKETLVAKGKVTKSETSETAKEESEEDSDSDYSTSNIEASEESADKQAPSESKVIEQISDKKVESSESKKPSSTMPEKEKEEVRKERSTDSDNPSSLASTSSESPFSNKGEDLKSTKSKSTPKDSGAKSGDNTEKKSQKPKTSSNWSPGVIAAAVSVAVVLIIVIWTLNQPKETNSSGVDNQQVEQMNSSTSKNSMDEMPEEKPTAAVKNSPEKVITKEEKSATSSQLQSENVAEKDNTLPTPAKPVDNFGLKGTFIASMLNFYGISVHSLNDEFTAKREKILLEDKGYRVGITKVTIKDQTKYRVFIGQFPTIDAAKTAIKDLPEKYQGPNAHFIFKIKKLNPL